MAVIEERPSVEEDFRSQQRSAAAVAPSGFSSDGYETASDTELNDIVLEPITHSSSNGDSLENRKSISAVQNGDVGGEVKEEEQQEPVVTIEREESEGKYEEKIKECTKALELNPSYRKALLRRADAQEKLEQYEESIAGKFLRETSKTTPDMAKILELDPSNDQARRTIRRLKPLADVKCEKMKEEMIGKLKDTGNSILGRFGMSIDKFKAVKDPNTGSYSISFQ